MASYAVKVYDECCMNGNYKQLHNPQIEDAFYIAENVWDNMQKIGTGIDKYLK